MIESSLHDQILVISFYFQNYEIELKGLIDIFDRKEAEERTLSDMSKLDRNEDNINNLHNQKKLVENLNLQLADEISNFKSSRENDILMIINKFFKDKYELNNDISKIFDTHINNK